MPLDPRDHHAKLTGTYDTTWWGIAEESGDDPDRYVVRRLADYDHATKLCDAHGPIRVSVGPGYGIVSFDTPGAKQDYVSPHVHSTDMGRTWYFSATGWEVPR